MSAIEPTRHQPCQLPADDRNYIEAGSAEVFRDEAVALASGIWEAGGSAELHVWAGGFHGFQTIVPTAAVSRRAVQTRESWLRRVLAP
jgi:acetyl esterase/lipase